LGRASLSMNAHNRVVSYGAYGEQIDKAKDGKRVHTAGRFIDDLRTRRVGNLALEAEYRCDALSLACYVRTKIRGVGKDMAKVYMVEVFEYDAVGHVGQHECAKVEEVQVILSFVLRDTLSRCMERFDMSNVRRDEIKLVCVTGSSVALPKKD